ncbi:helix-turn-helix domain-containing protein [Acinetobacter beijerinckii]|uniref:AraC family transcriptional regulator n=1 Tax=Acinetobacter beijerinckii TaxID=262668 RepID=UPI0023DD9732|nr:AraC family transcriptional regulator [Acinetobacter beijerinckii]MDF2416463.1 helix-turn-helix domain-containing protein [Acinetobacter beijerinckii]
MMNDQMLSSLFLKLVAKEGFFATAINGITLMRVDHTTPPLAVLQEPTLVFVLQGSKRGYIGTETYSFQQGECLIVSVSMPFDCDTVASAELPMIAVSMKLQADTVNELLAKTYFENEKFKPLTTGMSVIQYDQTISNVLIRLLKTLGSEQDSLVLGEQIKRELLYRVIQHSGADTLKGLVAQGNLRPIYKICEYIQHHFTEKLTVEMLAEQANMSTSAFHKAFKQVTQHSPLQYLKVTRLHKAKQMLQNENQSVAQAAYAVGYQSSSQFSREFKKQFGFSPNQTEVNIEKE